MRTSYVSIKPSEYDCRMKRHKASRHRRHVSHMAFPFRILLQRFSFALLITVSVGLVILERLHHPVMENMRIRVVNSVVPLVDVFSEPVEAIATIGKAINEIFYVHDENLYLHKEIAKLRKEALLTHQISSENARLHELLNFVGAQDVSFLTARVIATTAGPYTRSLTINAGTLQGVKLDQAVVSEEGLIGRVIEISTRTARVLLVTDINSHTPVIMEKSRERAMIKGNNSSQLEAVYLPQNSRISEGELAITSGDGDLFPSGMPVGIVQSNENGKVTVQSLADWSRLEYVSVIQ